MALYSTTIFLAAATARDFKTQPIYTSTTRAPSHNITIVINGHLWP